MARARLKIIVPAVLGGTLAIVGVFAADVALRSPARAYADDFDANLAATTPAVLAVARADPPLYRLLLEKSQAAFAQGGWPAARQVFHKIVDARIDAFAGDTTVLGCQAAWHDVYKALQPTPHLCRQLVLEGDWRLPAGIADAARAQRESACDRMTVDGGRGRLAVDHPPQMTRTAADATFSRALNGPKSLTEAQKRALNDPEGVAASDDATLCSAEQVFDENIEALPTAEAAAYERSLYANEEGDFLYLPHPISPLVQGPPPDLHCATPGTRFTLSLEDRTTGRPITWDSLGQSGWDCRVRSSATGEQGLFAGEAYASAGDILHLLWPLEIGKTAFCHCVYGKTTDLAVTGQTQIWLPWGYVDAVSIEETEREGDGQPAYTITRYWAPSLGMLIGRKTVVLRGRWPQGVGPDWQLVAMDRPAAPQAAAVSAPVSAPLPNVIGPGYRGEE
jgi:hypothetical protein